MENVVVVMLALIAMASPVVVIAFNGHQVRMIKEQDWERQDKVAADAARQQKEVADQAAEAAQLLLERQEASAARDAETAALLAAETRRAADVSTQQSGKLDQIHTLVNSSLTGAKQDTLNATIGQLATMHELAASRREQGKEPTPELLAAIDQTKAMIAELQSEIAARLEQTRIGEEQAKAGMA